MDTETFNAYAELALTGSGQHIAPERSYLVEARLSPIIRREGFSAASELMTCLGARPNKVLEAEVVAALTSKTTRFFSEREALTYIIETVLPARMDSGAEKLRIWCAGGSTGQEAYSLAMLLSELPQTMLGDTQIEIISTDICSDATTRARAGHYGHFEVQRGLSIQRLLKHFTRQEDGGWKISGDMRGRIGFRAHNLLDDARGLGQFDAILCRAVMPAMAPQLRAPLIERLYAQLSPSGALVLGDGETLPFLSDTLNAAEGLRHVYTRTSPATEVIAA